ncbi:MAG: hypothetical protein JNJ62_11150 [Pseudoxanthomonas mexicana]|nr:hypothetical protein [Pseudoxanthomonas mexicana]
MSRNAIRLLMSGSGPVPMWVRTGAAACAVVCVMIGAPWHAWHPLELAMDVLAPLMMVSLAFAHRWDSTLLSVSLVLGAVLWVAMLAAWRWLTLNA